MLNREQKAIDGTTPPDGVAVVRQRRDVAPHLGKNAAQEKGHEAEVRRSFRVEQHGVLVMCAEA